MSPADTLKPDDLAAILPEAAGAILAYLNLPPVGGYADREGPIRVGGDERYELPAEWRRPLLERRERIGRFGSMADLVGVPGFGQGGLRDLERRLGEVARYGNRLRPVWGGPESEREFFALVESAERYIHISTYIIGGEAGMRLMQLLGRKMAEGVKVRLMFCASGFVISGSPSGTGFVSRLSELRSYLFADLYVRKRLMRAIRDLGIPFVNTAPVGRHWTRRDFRAQGVKSAAAYERWARERAIPDAWIEEQERIDRECGIAFANVDHRKMVLIDGKRAFIGSQNVADSYFYSNELSADPRVNWRRWQWHDGSAILEGGVVQDLNRLFAQRWRLSGGEGFDPEDSFYLRPPERAGHAIVSLETSIPGMLRYPRNRNLSRFLLSLIGGDQRPVFEGRNPIRDRIRQLPELSERDLYVEHSYPSDAELLDHWAKAASGVRDFTLVVPLWYDALVLGMECDRYYPEMIARGVKLFGYQRAILHSKIAVVDGWYTATGSYNLTPRSGRADLELEFMVQCPEFGAAVRDRIRGDLEECRPIVPGPVDRLRSRASIPIFDALIRYFLL